MLCLGGINILDREDLEYWKVLIKTFNNQSCSCVGYFSVYILTKYYDEWKEFNDSQEKLPIIYQEIVEKSYFQHINNILKKIEKVNDDTWVIFTGLGLWHSDRIKLYNNCVDNLTKLNKEANIAYIRIARTIFSSKKGIYDNDNIFKALEEGKIFQHNNYGYGWGKLEEYCVKLEYLRKYLNFLIRQELINNNSDLYFLKYLNCSKFQYVQLNMEKIPINFWMYFVPNPTANVYFRRKYYTTEYQHIFDELQNSGILGKKKLGYHIHDNVNTKLGPGKIIELDKTNHKFKVQIDWEEKKDIVYLGYRELLKYDNNHGRKSLFLFVSTFVQNLELYFTHFDFSTMEPNYEKFRETIKIYLEKVIEDKYKSDNVIDKLQLLLDDREKDIDPDIYNNGLSKKIFDFLVGKKKFCDITNIHLIN